VCGKNIKKTLEGPERYARLQKLKSTYDLLKAKAVPNVDSISLSFADEIHGAVAYLEPKGVSVLPVNTLEVFEAICCVLEALVVSLFKSMDPNIIIKFFLGYARRPQANFSQRHSMAKHY